MANKAFRDSTTISTMTKICLLLSSRTLLVRVFEILQNRFILLRSIALLLNYRAKLQFRKALVKPIVARICILLLLSVTGCGFLKRNGSPNTRKDDAGPKLKAAGSEVVLRTFGSTEFFVAPVPPPKTEGPFHLKLTWVPGEIRFESFTKVDPLNAASMEQKKVKGVRVQVSTSVLVIDGRKGEQRKGWADLDDTEARDLDTTLSFLAETAVAWNKKKPEPRQEVSYHLKNYLLAALTYEKDEPELLLLLPTGESGLTGVTIPATNISEVQGKLRAAIKNLGTS